MGGRTAAAAAAVDRRENRVRCRSLYARPNRRHTLARHGEVTLTKIVRQPGGFLSRLNHGRRLPAARDVLADHRNVVSPGPRSPLSRTLSFSDRGCPTRVWTFTAPHSPRRPKLNSRMKSFSLDSSDQADQAQRRRMGSGGGGGSGSGGVGSSGCGGGSGQQLESHSNPSSSSRLQCTYA